MGSVVTLPTPYSVPKPSTIESALFQEAAGSSFLNWLGFNPCRGGGQTISSTGTILTTTNAVASAPGIAASSISTTNSTSQPLTRPPLTDSISTPSSLPTPIPIPKPSQKNVKLAVGVAVPLGSITISALVVFLWRVHHQRRHVAITSQVPQNEEDSLAFLQRKAELEAEERRRYELHAGDIRHEMETRENRSELHGGARRQELRGEEHSRELPAST